MLILVVVRTSGTYVVLGAATAADNITVQLV